VEENARRALSREGGFDWKKDYDTHKVKNSLTIGKKQQGGEGGVYNFSSSPEANRNQPRRRHSDRKPCQGYLLTTREKYQGGIAAKNNAAQEKLEKNQRASKTRMKIT